MRWILKNEMPPTTLTFSNRPSGSFLPFTLAALWSSFLASSFLPWLRSQRADSGRNLVWNTRPDVTLATPVVTLVKNKHWYLYRPVEESPNDDERAEERRLQVPPVADQIGNAGQHHQSNRAENQDQRCGKGGLWGTSPLHPCHNVHVIKYMTTLLRLLYILISSCFKWVSEKTKDPMSYLHEFAWIIIRKTLESNIC